MKLHLSVFTILTIGLLISCNPDKPEGTDTTSISLADSAINEPIEETVLLQEVQSERLADSIPYIHEPYDEASLPDTAFVVMNRYTTGFVYDMKYASTDNFMKAAVYDCDLCLLRKEVADALMTANNSFMEHGLMIKFFDCYRPLDVQKKMWQIYPNARYVADPHTTGSVHNKGGAVDITLVDQYGNELDMGTDFDHFGKEAHHAYQALPDTVLNNRRLLKEVMEASGFRAITSEWWHYSFRNKKKYTVSNFQVACAQ